MNKITEIKGLINLLNKYRDEYYNGSNSSISDTEYDKLFDKLVELETEYGIYLSNSPTQSVGYEVKSKLNKVKHNHPMLSLDKTKSISDIVEFFKYHEGIAMLKMDGLTCSVAYHQDLISAETRGNGEIGEDVLHNAKVVTNLPSRVNHNDLIVDGEMIIDYPTFEKINSKMLKGNEFKNPRNLCSGSIRQLDSKIAAEREIKFIAWKCVKGINDNDFINRLNTLKEYGFEVVPFLAVPKNPTEKQIEDIINTLKEEASKNGFPIDGIVFGYRNVEYGDSLGMTSHHINSQIAFKFKNDIEYTTLNGVQWQVGRTGQIVPVGLLETVNILDTDVSKVSLHNLKVLEDLNIKIGATVGIIKSNEIIPMCVECDGNGEDIVIPDKCPCCGAPAEIRCINDSKMLYCTNPDCSAKFTSKLANFVSRNGMNIVGLSKQTLEVLVGRGYVESFIDLYHLEDYKAELSALPGFGARSVSKLLKAIDDSRKVDLTHLLTALGINLVGKSTAKDISVYCHGSIDEFISIVNDTILELESINGVGTIVVESIDKWWNENSDMVYSLLEEIEIEIPVEKKEKFGGTDLSGKTFCITGSLNHFSSRDELKTLLESMNAKVSGSVSKNTFALICNDKDSNTGKSKRAKELGINIWTEDELLKYIDETN